MPVLSGRCPIFKRIKEAFITYVLDASCYVCKMITLDDLLSQNSRPGLSNISLSLYKDFYVGILCKRLFRYYFIDDTQIDVSFWKYGLYHLLGIQHIDYTITKENFIRKIDEGLDFNQLKQDKKLKERFRNMADRIEYFSCIYYILRYARIFRVPSEILKGTKDVRIDYIIYQDLDKKGINIGLKQIYGIMAPITILIDRTNHRGKHIDFNYEKVVKKLEIIDISAEQVIESYVYTNDFVVKGLFNHS